jgi:hypothetical protein
VPYLLAAVATRASSARATGARSGGGAGAGNGSGEGGGSAGAGHTGGGVAARACPIRKPLVRYTKAPLDACKAKNLRRAR